MERACIGDRLLGAAQVGFGHDLQQRRAGAVEVDAAHPAESVMQRLAGVFLEVGPREAHALALYPDRSPLHYGLLVLADLVALRQVGVEVVLAREDRAAVDRAADREAETDRVLERAAVEHREQAGQREVDGRRLCVRRRAELGGCPREDLAAREELRVRFDADDDFPVHAHLAPWRSSSQLPRRSISSRSRCASAPQCAAQFSALSATKSPVSRSVTRQLPATKRRPPRSACCSDATSAQDCPPGSSARQSNSASFPFFTEKASFAW